jgi:hypothetical protein
VETNSENNSAQNPVICIAAMALSSMASETMENGKHTYVLAYEL